MPCTDGKSESRLDPAHGKDSPCAGKIPLCNSKLPRELRNIAATCVGLRLRRLRPRRRNEQLRGRRELWSLRLRQEAWRLAPDTPGDALSPVSPVLARASSSSLRTVPRNFCHVLGTADLHWSGNRYNAAHLDPATVLDRSGSPVLVLDENRIWHRAGRRPTDFTGPRSEVPESAVCTIGSQ